MQKGMMFLLILLVSFGAVLAANFGEETTKQISSWFSTEKGEIFLLQPGESKEIKTREEIIVVELLEIGYDPRDVSDLRLDNILFSDETPGVGESVHITVTVTNIGTGSAYNVALDPLYGDEGLGHGHSGMGRFEIASEETVTFELDHMWETDGVYITVFMVKTLNDVNNGNNVECEEIIVGSGGSGSGGCIGFGPNDITKKAHLTYRSGLNEEELWLNQDDLGYLVEVLKLNDRMALLTVPM